MKGRIMRYLNEFASGEENELANELRNELALDAQTFQSHAREVQAAILHNYSQFSISTIDAFFQKVIRSFTREAGVLGDYRLEVEQDLVMGEVIGNLIDELGERPQLTKWIVELALQNLENDRSWDMRNSLVSFSNEIFREEFRAVEGSIEQASTNIDYFRDTLDALRKKKHEYVNFVSSRAKLALKDFHALGLQTDDFKYKNNGSAYGWFAKVAEFKSVKDFSDKEKGSRSENEFQSAGSWVDKNHPRSQEIIRLANEKWIDLLNQILNYRKINYSEALSAELAISNFYAFGLLTDISRKLAEYKRDNNVMLLADAPQFLNGIIQDSDTPFIYEKAGSFYRNFLIDEFQDTSGLQWKNLQPLLTNGLDSGYPSLVVGDVKQAIYRWRGGDQGLLQKAIEDQVGVARTEIKLLNKNFRSAKEIVSFNNALFQSAAASTESGSALAQQEYHDVRQEATKTTDGFVRVKFLSDAEDVKWKDEALTQTVLCIEELQRQGARPRDIALLVRTNVEGQEVISFLLQHKNSTHAKAECCYEIVSSESLRIDSAGSVNLLTSALTYLLNPEDAIARAQLAYEYSRQRPQQKAMAEVFAVSNTVVFENNLPEAFAQRKIFLRKLPLFELTETLIEIFELGKWWGELPYLLAFQDLVLDFCNRERNDLRAFLDWWETNKTKKSIVAPAGAEAMPLLTLHKAKGLQFNYVIVPFCSWSLDHEPLKSPNLWVESSASVFEGIGHLPVKYSSALKESLFAEDYALEHSRVYLDNLNLLYVALTRAENGLVVFAPDQKVKNNKNSVARVLHESIERSAELSANWSATNQTWHSGSLTVAPAKKNEEVNTMSLAAYNTHPWRGKLILKKTAPHHASKDDLAREKINYGIHLHAAFSLIHDARDIPNAIYKMVTAGTINHEESERLNQLVDKLLEQKQVADWFSQKWDVRNEVHTLLPGGTEYRIDRLLIDGKRAIVIDYKTGSPKKEDQRQIVEYCLMLNEMGFDSEGYLFYLTEGEVVSVVPPKISKKKNLNQLGLDF